MYCKKCKYYSFDSYDKCPKCGLDWDKVRKELNLDWVPSGNYQWFSLNWEENPEEDFIFENAPAAPASEAKANTVYDFSVDDENPIEETEDDEIGQFLMGTYADEESNQPAAPFTVDSEEIKPLLITDDSSEEQPDIINLDESSIPNLDIPDLDNLPGLASPQQKSESSPETTQFELGDVSIPELTPPEHSDAPVSDLASIPEMELKSDPGQEPVPDLSVPGLDDLTGDIDFPVQGAETAQKTTPEAKKETKELVSDIVIPGLEEMLEKEKNEPAQPDSLQETMPATPEAPPEEEAISIDFNLLDAGLDIENEKAEAEPTAKQPASAHQGRQAPKVRGDSEFSDLSAALDQVLEIDPSQDIVEVQDVYAVNNAENFGDIEIELEFDEDDEEQETGK